MVFKKCIPWGDQLMEFLSVTFIIPAIFVIVAFVIIFLMYIFGSNDKTEIKYVTPEECFSDCGGDAVKMADKFLKNYNSLPWGDMIYLQRELIKAQRDSLK